MSRYLAFIIAVVLSSYANAERVCEHAINAAQLQDTAVEVAERDCWLPVQQVTGKHVALVATGDRIAYKVTNQVAYTSDFDFVQSDFNQKDFLVWVHGQATASPILMATPNLLDQLTDQYATATRRYPKLNADGLPTVVDTIFEKTLKLDDPLKQNVVYSTAIYASRFSGDKAVIEKLFDRVKLHNSRLAPHQQVQMQVEIARTDIISFDDFDLLQLLDENYAHNHDFFLQKLYFLYKEQQNEKVRSKLTSFLNKRVAIILNEQRCRSFISCINLSRYSLFAGQYDDARELTNITKKTIDALINDTTLYTTALESYYRQALYLAMVTADYNLAESLIEEIDAIGIRGEYDEYIVVIADIFLTLGDIDRAASLIDKATVTSNQSDVSSKIIKAKIIGHTDANTATTKLLKLYNDNNGHAKWHTRLQIVAAMIDIGLTVNQSLMVAVVQESLTKKLTPNQTEWLLSIILHAYQVRYTQIATDWVAQLDVGRLSLYTPQAKLKMGLVDALGKMHTGDLAGAEAMLYKIINKQIQEQQSLTDFEVRGKVLRAQRQAQELLVNLYIKQNKLNYALYVASFSAAKLTKDLSLAKSANQVEQAIKNLQDTKSAAVLYMYSEFGSWQFVVDSSGVTAHAIDKASAQMLLDEIEIASVTTSEQHAKLDNTFGLSRLQGYDNVSLVLDGALQKFPVEQWMPNVVVTRQTHVFYDRDTSLFKPAKTAMFYDAIYNDADNRIAESVSLNSGGNEDDDLERLGFTKFEATSIGSVLKQGLTHFEGASASLDNLVNLPAQDALHLAVHGKVDYRYPSKSALVLSRYNNAGEWVNGSLNFDAIAKLAPHRLVVLSACDSSLGANDIGGGAVGLGHAFLSNGSQMVVSSLWPQADKASAMLMIMFYHYLKTMPPADALHNAKLYMKSKDNKYSDPYYWAGYTLTTTQI